MTTNQQYIEEIIRSKKTCYFISPHYDDAAFSAGELARHLKQAKKNRIVVINVFTRSGPSPYSMSAKAYLKQCNYQDAAALYKDRDTEDKNALSTIADEVIDLGLTEALWRPSPHRQKLRKYLPELALIYPTYRFHISKGKISRSDTKTFMDIQRNLIRIIDPSNSIVFSPLGIGNHVDHVITRAACDGIFPNTIHWADYPYNLAEPDTTSKTGAKHFQFQGDNDKKRQLMSKYKTQYAAMFHNPPILPPETFSHR